LLPSRDSTHRRVNLDRASGGPLLGNIPERSPRRLSSGLVSLNPRRAFRVDFGAHLWRHLRVGVVGYCEERLFERRATPAGAPQDA
jgi:hypothetical protein